MILILLSFSIMVKFSNPQEVPSLSGPARLSSMDNNPHGSNPQSECVLQPQLFSIELGFCVVTNKKCACPEWVIVWQAGVYN